MSTTDDLIPVLKRLKLSGVLASLELRMRQVGEQAQPCKRFDVAGCRCLQGAEA